MPYNKTMTQGESFVFVSYTGADEPWATWIASALENAGLAARIQVWDSPPGRNFVQWMNAQLADARWTVALYSHAYFTSDWCTTEWTTALARHTLLPVRLEPVKPPETLRTLTWVDLFDLDEDQARQRLLYAVGMQVLPRLAAFPGRLTTPQRPPAFPGLPGAQPDPAIVLAAALGHLGSPALAVRLAGIRAMERSANAEHTDPALVDEVRQVLAAFLRGSAIASYSTTAPEDLRAAAGALGRIPGGKGLDLSDAWLSGADLTGADLREADLTGAWLSQEQLDVATGNGATLLPTGLVRPTSWPEREQPLFFPEGLPRLQAWDAGAEPDILDRS
ncbi:TIR domain-containing protein [Frankia sp. Cas4]|uniref:TIR domain-containing protein n=1 Tax=Frankia sp. Cas4 TaxID=3073927 RepID=UPI002AD2DE21|nr:TIR domain-containing protein [Frankia sp. Cas4]